MYIQALTAHTVVLPCCTLTYPARQRIATSGEVVSRPVVPPTPAGNLLLRRSPSTGRGGVAWTHGCCRRRRLAASFPDRLSAQPQAIPSAQPSPFHRRIPEPLEVEFEFPSSHLVNTYPAPRNSSSIFLLPPKPSTPQPRQCPPQSTGIPPVLVSIEPLPCSRAPWVRLCGFLRHHRATQRRSRGRSHSSPLPPKWR